MDEFGGFDASTVEPEVAIPSKPIPAGEYRAMIVKSEKRETKAKKEGRANRGSLFEFVFEVCAGEYKGKRIWSYINFENDSAKAESIGRSELAAICRAIGKLRPKQSAELHNVPLIIGVTVVERDDKKGPDGETLYSNEIESWKSIEEASSTASQPAASSAVAGTSEDPFA